MRKLLLSLALLTFSMISMAQEVTVSGRLSILNNLPLQNFKVKTMKTGESATTDANGHFSIKAVDKDFIIAEGEPFKTAKVKVKVVNNAVDSVNILMTFPRKPNVLTGIMEAGYLDSIYEQEAFKNLIFRKDYTKYTTIEDAISVELPHLQNMGPDCYQMPGATSMNGPNGCMLLVVGNHIVSTISDVPTSNIEDIYVLKGAQAGVWGVQGANGVLVIKIKNDDSDIDTRSKD